MSSILKPLASPMLAQGMQATLSVFNNGGSVDSSMDADMKDIQEQIEMYRDCMTRKAMCDSTGKSAQSCVYKDKALACKRKAAKLIEKYREKYGRTENSSWMQFNNGGKIRQQESVVDTAKEKLNESFALPIEMAVYVPSTKGANEKISEAEFRERIEETERYLSSKFGGFSKVDIDGGYVSDEKGLIKEDVAKVVAFSQDEDFLSNKLPRLIQRITLWCGEWTQESIGFEIEGDLFYIDKNFEYDKKMFNNGGQTNVFYTLLDEDGDIILTGVSENRLIEYANIMFWYDIKDSGESDINTLQDAIEAFDTLDYQVKMKSTAFGGGGSIAEGNYEMALSKAKEFKHHASEFQDALKKEKKIEAWVVAKAERASSDLSDITHYLDGKSEYADGGQFGGGGAVDDETIPNEYKKYISPKFTNTLGRLGKVILTESDVEIVTDWMIDKLHKLKCRFLVIKKMPHIGFIQVISRENTAFQEEQNYELWSNFTMNVAKLQDYVLSTKHVKDIEKSVFLYPFISGKITLEDGSQENIKPSTLIYDENTQRYTDKMWVRMKFGDGGSIDALKKTLNQLESKRANWMSVLKSRVGKKSPFDNKIYEIEQAIKKAKDKSSDFYELPQDKITRLYGKSYMEKIANYFANKFTQPISYSKFLNSLKTPMQKEAFRRLLLKTYQSKWKVKPIINKTQDTIKFRKEYADGGEFGGGGSVTKKLKRIVRKGTKYGNLAIKKAKPKAKKIVRKLKIGFDALAKKVAKSYEGKAVAPKYQKEYGKRYSKEEAQEVGNKVAAKVKRMKGM